MRIQKNMTMEETVINRVQAYADNAGLSLSAAFSVLATQKLDELDAIKQLPELSDILKKAMLFKKGSTPMQNKPSEANESLYPRSMEECAGCNSLQFCVEQGLYLECQGER